MYLVVTHLGREDKKKQKKKKIERLHKNSLGHLPLQCHLEYPWKNKRRKKKLPCKCSTYSAPHFDLISADTLWKIQR